MSFATRKVKTTAATKSAINLCYVITSRVKAYVRSKGKRTSAEFITRLSRVVADSCDLAIAECPHNRQTIK